MFVLRAEPGEAALLGGPGRGGGARALVFERFVKAFVPSVLFGMRGFNQLRRDAEPNPPGRQPGEAAEGAGGEGYTVVGADPVGGPYSRDSRSNVARVGASSVPGKA